MNPLVALIVCILKARSTQCSNDYDMKKPRERKKIFIEFDEGELKDILSELGQAKNCIDRILPPSEIERKGVVDLLVLLSRKLKN